MEKDPQVRTRSSRRLPLLASLALSAMLASGCATSQLGAAAVVGDETISVSTIETSVVGLLDARRSFGDQDTETVRSGEQARNMLRFHMYASVVRQLAKKRGISISEGQKRALEREFIDSSGGLDQLRLALAQNGIAPEDLDLYIELFLYRGRLGEALLPGNDPELQTPRNEAIERAILDFYAKERISVNPRFGVIDLKSGLISTRDDTNGGVALPPL